jgi:hypothetical protein
LKYCAEEIGIGQILCSKGGRMWSIEGAKRFGISLARSA